MGNRTANSTLNEGASGAARLATSLSRSTVLVGAFFAVFYRYFAYFTRDIRAREVSSRRT